MDFTTLAFSVMGSAWLSGINLYATVLTLGLLQRYNLVHLPGHLSYVSNWWVIGIAAVFFVMQFIADKVPAVDSIGTPSAPSLNSSGAILAASTFADFDPSRSSPGTACRRHVGTQFARHKGGYPASRRHLSRAVFEYRDEPDVEDALTIGGAYLIGVHPLVILGVVAVGLLASALIFRFIFKAFPGHVPAPAPTGNAHQLTQDDALHQRRSQC